MKQSERTAGVVENNAGKVPDPKLLLVVVLGRDVDVSLPVLLVHLLHHGGVRPLQTDTRTHRQTLKPLTRT